MRISPSTRRRVGLPDVSITILPHRLDGDAFHASSEKLAANHAGLTKPVCIGRYDDLVRAVSLQTVRGDVHGALRSHFGRQPLLEDAYARCRRLCEMFRRTAAVASVQLLAKIRIPNASAATGEPKRSRCTAKAARHS